jgi:hypothetical protein
MTADALLICEAEHWSDQSTVQGMVDNPVSDAELLRRARILIPQLARRLDIYREWHERRGRSDL